MRDGMNPDLHSLLSPAEGFDPKHELFSESPIEALDWLKELGQIAKESIDPIVSDSATEEEQKSASAGAAVSTLLDASSPNSASATSASTDTAAAAIESPAPAVLDPRAAEEAKLLEALLAYHRLRNPAIGATTAPRPSKDTLFARVDASSAPGNHFAPLEIPVVKNVAPKAASSTFHSTQPTQTVLRPKNQK